MNVVQSEDCNWIFHRNYPNLQKVAGYGELRGRKPHVTIGHILRRIWPLSLQRLIKALIKWRSDEGFKKRLSNAFMLELDKLTRKFKKENWCKDLTLLDFLNPEYESFKLFHKRRNQKQSFENDTRPNNVVSPTFKISLTNPFSLQSLGKRKRDNANE